MELPVTRFLMKYHLYLLNIVPANKMYQVLFVCMAKNNLLNCLRMYFHYTI